MTKQASFTFVIPPGTPAKSCLSCGKIIYWIVTKNDKRMPLNGDGVSHFATCPDAATHRRVR